MIPKRTDVAVTISTLNSECTRIRKLREECEDKIRAIEITIRELEKAG